MESTERFLSAASNWAWGPPMLLLLMGTHLFLKIGLVWSLADIANALMAMPNLVSLLALSGVIVAETRLHLWEVSSGGEDHV